MYGIIGNVLIWSSVAALILLKPKGINRAIGIVLVVIIFTVCSVTFGREKLRGIQQLSGRNPEEALVHYQHSLINFPCPNDFEIRYWRGVCFSDLKQYDNAIYEYSKSIDIYNKISFVLFIYSLPLGYGPFHISSSVYADVAELYENRGIAYMALHYYDKAILDYNKAVQYTEQGRNFPSIHNLLYRSKHAPAQRVRYLRSLCYFAIGDSQLAENELSQLKREGYVSEFGDEELPTMNNWYQHIQSIAWKK